MIDAAQGRAWLHSISSHHDTLHTNRDHQRYELHDHHTDGGDESIHDHHEDMHVNHKLAQQGQTFHPQHANARLLFRLFSRRGAAHTHLKKYDDAKADYLLAQHLVPADDAAYAQLLKDIAMVEKLHGAPAPDH